MGQNLALETLTDDAKNLLEGIIELEETNSGLSMARELADQLLEEMLSLCDE